ncbi:cell wall protein DAN4 [Drosophila erecta]|uniref:Integumentary mucin C.1-like n=1 Tax=Drosophila erecta TaxID=7220 RepID=B3NSF9_DROER|nr:cell wall protein DAN4 [Drosophila erecta]EDV56461.1 uncharacterized protein Dere_GG22647 [Drosophila erecta]
MKSAVICLFFIATAAWDVQAEVPTYLEPPTIGTTTTDAPVMTTLAEETTTQSFITTTTAPRTTTESAPTSTTEISNPPTTEISTTPTTAPSTTTSATETTTATTTALTTTNAIQDPATTTTEPNTASTTQGDPIYPIYPTHKPPYVRPTNSGRPPYYPTNPWIWNYGNPAVKCYLKNVQEYRRDYYGMVWQPKTICYHCCYYVHNRIDGCNLVHQGPCSWHDHARWISSNSYVY